jgi:hypothetical protein
MGWVTNTGLGGFEFLNKKDEDYDNIDTLISQTILPDLWVFEDAETVIIIHF